MSHAETVAWIFYALAAASRSGAAKFADISAVADGINHAIPTHSELQVSLSWLVERALAQCSNRRYSLTPKGLGMVEAARRQSTTMLGVWHALSALVAREEVSAENGPSQEAPSR
jgi:hypothetical protein